MEEKTLNKELNELMDALDIKHPSHEDFENFMKNKEYTLCIGSEGMSFEKKREE